MSQPLRIILAEDEFLCLVGIRDNLIMLGHDVVSECSSGEELYDLALNLKPDLIITDINMQTMDGIEAIKRINGKIQIPAIIVSGYDDRELIERATDQGVFYYLIKPIDIKDLRVAISVTMAKYAEFLDLKHELFAAQENLETRKLVERAKGLLMERKKLNEMDAMKRLQKISKDSNMKMASVAQSIIKSYETSP
jgi:response regulator NasT